MSYYETLIHRAPNLPADVLQAIELYERFGEFGGIEFTREYQGEYWDSVRLNIRRMPLPWVKAVQLVR